MISQIRFSGLASGLDTEAIVKNLMAVERMPMNKLLQQRQWQEWQQTAYREANAKLLELRGSMEKLRLNSTFLQEKITSSRANDVEVAKVGNPSLSHYSITVNKLATAPQPASVKFKEVDDAIANGGEFGQSFSFTIEGSKGAKEIQIKDDDTIHDAIAKINAVSKETGVTAFYSDGEKRIVLTTTATGKDAAFEISGNDIDNGNPLGLINGKIYMSGEEPFHTFSDSSEIDVVFGTNGEAAEISINGVTIRPASNTFTYDGMRFTLKSVTTDPISISKEIDEEAIFNDIKTFVEKYNEVIKELNDKLRERKYRDFPPLLAEQKEEMTEREIELWEEKAKSGLLRNDSILSKALTNMRTSLYSEVDLEQGALKSLSQIGITTSDDYLENGKLIIDEDRLRDAIHNHLDDVRLLFASNSEDASKKGIGWRIYDHLNDAMKELTAKAGSSATVDNSFLGKSIGRIDDQISAFERRLAMIEERYWRQFTAMERAIQQANSQSSWLMQQFMM